jgi:hypothetical protein
MQDDIIVLRHSMHYAYNCINAYETNVQSLPHAFF